MKESAYSMKGKTQADRVKHSEKRLKEISIKLDEANREVERLKEEHAASIQKRTVKLYENYDKLKASNKADEDNGEEELENAADILGKGNKADYEALMAMYRDHEAKNEAAKEN